MRGVSTISLELIVNPTDTSLSLHPLSPYMIKAAILDLDGTVYEGSRLIEGADTAIAEMRRKGIKVIFCTNNSSRPAADISEKLNSMGIPCDVDDVVSSASLALRYASDYHLEKVYFCGSDKMRNEFVKNGIALCRPEECRNLIIGMDTEYNYQKMTQGVRAALKAERIIICNEDRLYPAEDGVKPGCGAMVHSILSVTQKKYDVILGKPGTAMMSFISEKFGFGPEEMMVIGDTETSDVAMADAYGSPSLLIGKDIRSLKDAPLKL